MKEREREEKIGIEKVKGKKKWGENVFREVKSRLCFYVLNMWCIIKET